MTAHKQTLGSDDAEEADVAELAGEYPHDRISGILPTAGRVLHVLAHPQDSDDVKAKDLMKPVPAVLHASSTIRIAVEVIQTLEMRYLPNFVGNEYIGNLQDALARPVHRLLGHAAVSVDTDSSVTEALACMLHYEIAAVSVIDDDGVLVGVLDYKDVLRALPLAREARVAARPVNARTA